MNASVHGRRSLNCWRRVDGSRVRAVNIETPSVSPAFVPRLFFSHDEFVAAAHAAVSTAAPKRPVAVLVASLDERETLTTLYGRPRVEEFVDTVAEIAQRTLRGDDFVTRGGDDRMLMVLSDASGDDAQA